jgi:hypothetical protein
MAASFHWTFGPGFAYKELAAHGGNPNQGEKPWRRRKLPRSSKRARRLSRERLSLSTPTSALVAEILRGLPDD